MSFAASLMLVLALALPWYAPPSTNVVTKSVTFTNQGAKLHGTLYLPESKHPVPAIIVFHGASEPLANLPIYRHLSEGLTQLGIAVLLYDRRGNGASTGSEDVPYETLADDGIAGARALRTMPQIDAKRVGYWGISQGGWLATFAATRDRDAAFAIAVSAPMTTPESQMAFADANHLVALGYSKAQVSRHVASAKDVDRILAGHKFARGRCCCDRKDTEPALVSVHVHAHDGANQGAG